MSSNSSANNPSKTVLNEFESKRFLDRYRIPVIEEILVRDAEGAAAAAEEMGYPVVVKAVGETLPHKTEVGGVALNLRTEADVWEAGASLLRIPGCQGLLVQRMAHGQRELVCGLVRDPHFGPCVMIGIGGVLTEALEKIAFRLAPIYTQDASQMIREILPNRFLAPLRGEDSVDLHALTGILVSLGEIGSQHPEVLEVDLNPLKIQPNGRPVAVDALIVLKPGEQLSPLPWQERGEREIRLESSASLTPFFEPRRVVIVGASATPGKPGYELLRNIQANGFDGEVLCVNPKGGEILGYPVYPSARDLPEGIDLAILIVPASATPEALRDCASRGIRNVVLLAGGFAEVDERGIQLQEELENLIKEHKLRVLGPNTSGHISTPQGFTSAFFPLGKIRSGRVSYIAQTGNFATHTMKNILTSEYFGVARVIGLGNKIDIDESDSLAYLGKDDSTQAILMYLESIKNPKRFLEIAREVTRRKPVIALKSASTEAGKQAAIAHTAALAAEDRLVDGLLQQAGIVRVFNYTDLILVGKALSMVELPQGPRVSFLAPSGALLVALSDLATRLGLVVSEIEPGTQRRLQEISPPYLRMRNPVDIWGAALVKGIEAGYREGMEAVLADPNIDAVIPILMLSRETGLPSYDFLIDLKQKYPQKPILVTYSGVEACFRDAKAILEPAGIPTFAQVEQPFQVLSILARCRQVLIAKT